MDFKDSAKETVRDLDIFSSISIDKPEHIRGYVKLPSGVKVLTDLYFHKENVIENEIRKAATYNKEYFGEIFVKYIVIKK